MHARVGHRRSEITDDISDARIYGGIHFRFDQEAGADLGRAIAKYEYKHTSAARNMAITTTRVTTTKTITTVNTITKTDDYRRKS